MTIQELLQDVRALDCSDLHLSEGLPATMRLHGKLVNVQDKLGEGADTKALILSLCSAEQKQRLANGEDLDFAFEMNADERYRVNVFHERHGLAAAIRILRGSIPTLADLNLPPVLMQFCKEPNGLILVTGPTGSGKSTTLAAMIDQISHNSGVHILTVEDPIEYVLPQRNALLHQREVGRTVGSFAQALRSALREDPDVLLVGEMRDYETIATAVTAAETGHLVLSTLHTTGAAQTIDRIVDTCPPQAQQQMRMQLSMILRGVVTQQLLPLASGTGRAVATEVLVCTDAVANLIRENKCFQLGTNMQSGQSVGMHTMNSELIRLVREGKITQEVAYAHSNDKAEFRQYLD